MFDFEATKKLFDVLVRKHLLSWFNSVLITEESPARPFVALQ